MIENMDDLVTSVARAPIKTEITPGQGPVVLISEEMHKTIRDGLAVLGQDMPGKRLQVTPDRAIYLIKEDDATRLTTLLEDYK